MTGWQFVGVIALAAAIVVLASFLREADASEQVGCLAVVAVTVGGTLAAMLAVGLWRP